MNQGKIFVERLKARKAIEKILTDEQKKTIAQAKKRWLKKARERRDQWRMRQYQHPPKP
jgi:Spy/CpxP family protein refolding chaperone